MRKIIFDIETTGLDCKEERIIEICAIELINDFKLGEIFHVYINPEGRDVHPQAFAVHGISLDQLIDKPKFSGIVEEFIDFIGQSKLIAHNAQFDVSFLNEEFKRLDFPPIEADRIIDTLILSRKKHPMGPNNLDALCRRYAIDNTKRNKHGALVDTELLAEVYIALIGGRQRTMILENENRENKKFLLHQTKEKKERPIPLQPRITKQEAQDHEKMILSLGANSMWLQWKKNN